MKSATSLIRDFLVCVSAALLLAPGAAIGQIPDLYNLDLVDEAFETESAQYSGTGVFVERFVSDVMLMTGSMSGLSELGCASCVFSKIEEISMPGGGSMFMAYIMSMLEVYELGGIGMGADTMSMLGAGMMMGQILMNTQVAGLVPSVGPDYMNPGMMFFSGGQMILEGAQARRAAAASLAASNATVQAEANQFADIRSLLRNTGVMAGPLGPMTCFRAEGFDTPMATGEGETARMNAAGLCIDNDERLILSHRIEGTMEAEGESREFFIEVENSDFRHVDGCNLYKPYRRVNRMGGILNDAQMAEMQEATAQLAEFEQQLAGMSPAERAMMESMVGSQMDMVRNMANGGAIEHVQEIEEIICDPDLRAMLDPAASGYDLGPVVDLAQIQRDLVTLGYAPGNTEGVMDTLTEIAISQYQAERGLSVTGQPSADLQAMLATEVAAQTQ